MLRCLIIDDKPLAIEILADYVRKTPFLELIASTTNPIEGLQLCREQKTDLIFLDIQMRELTGIQFMKIVGSSSKFILTTAYADYALDGYEHDVVDYLLKPIAFDRFYRAAEKALQLSTSLNPGSLSESNITIPAIPEYIFVKTEHRIQRVNLCNLLYIEALQNYILLHTDTGRLMSLQTLKSIEDQLPKNDFVRVHRSYIVNLRHIVAVERGRISIGDAVIAVGDTYRDSFYRIIS